MLDVMLKESLVDVCVVATRYFGGTLLGAGGLVRAYSHTSKIALEAAGIITMAQCSVMRLMFQTVSMLLNFSAVNFQRQYKKRTRSELITLYKKNA